MATLDLSNVERAPVKVKLPDGQLYDLADPDSLGALPMQRLVSRYRRSQELMGKADATDADVEEMFDLLIDVAQVIVPDADREVIGRLSLTPIERLVQAFFDASPTIRQAGEASTSAS